MYVNIKLLALIVVYNEIGKSITDSFDSATSPAVVMPIPNNSNVVFIDTRSLEISDISMLDVHRYNLLIKNLTIICTPVLIRANLNIPSNQVFISNLL